jgi:hypothetical protein
MSNNAEDSGAARKDRWDKWKIILEPVGGILTAVAVVFLTYSTSRRLGHWQEQANNARVYTELMGKREEAETGLRKAMFDSIMGAFLSHSAEPMSKEPEKSTEADLLKPESGKSIEPDVLKLELLAYNFHDSLNLAPLFKTMERKIERKLHTDTKDRVAVECLRRLRKVANDIAGKQLATLTTADGKNSALLLRGTFQQPLNTEYVSRSLILGDVTHDITVGVTNTDPVTQELQLSVTVRTSNSRGAPQADQYPERHVEFWIGSFEFPMIDNTRLPNNQFCAVVLRVFEPDPETKAVPYEVHGVCFPGSRAALKEKPYYDEILDHLRQANSMY